MGADLLNTCGLQHRRGGSDLFGARVAAVISQKATRLDESHHAEDSPIHHHHRLLVLGHWKASGCAIPSIINTVYRTNLHRPIHLNCLETLQESDLISQDARTWPDSASEICTNER
jgi:hypothetical protein